MRFNFDFVPPETVKTRLILVVKPVLEKLSGLKVNHIGYRCFYPDGGSFGFTTNEKWYTPERTEEFLENQRIFLEQELIHLLINGFCYVTRSREATDNYYLRALAERAMSNSLGIYKFSTNKIEHFFFIASEEDCGARDIMLNHLDDLNNIVSFLRAEIEKLFDQNNRPKSEFFLNEKITEFLFSKTTIDIRTKQEALIKGQKLQLTKREIEVLGCLKLASSNKIIAKQLNLSPRTVENHITKLKSKFCCNRID